jgi:hypothetical protein
MGKVERVTAASYASLEAAAIVKTDRLQPSVTMEGIEPSSHAWEAGTPGFTRRKDQIKLSRYCPLLPSRIWLFVFALSQTSLSRYNPLFPMQL